MGNRNPQNRKAPKPGRFGTDIVAYSTPLTDFTATATATQVLASPWPPSSSDADFLEGISIQMHTAGADADGTMLCKVQKVRGGSGGTTIDLTDTFSVESGTVSVTPKAYDFPLLSTLTPAQLSFLQGDVLVLSKTNTSAGIDTQPVGVIVAEFAKGA